MMDIVAPGDDEADGVDDLDLVLVESSDSDMFGSVAGEADANVDANAQIPDSLIYSSLEQRPSSSMPKHSTMVIEESIVVDKLNEDGNRNIISNAEQQKLQYTPPNQFRIKAHVQTNLHTGYSYFLPEESLSTSPANLLFLECGAIGSTTESLPLVSGVFRHVPHSSLFPKRDESTAIKGKDIVEQEQMQTKDEVMMDGLDIDKLLTLDESVSTTNQTTNHDETADSEGERNNKHPKRPSPPKYVVALSPLEITVGGNGNETQKFVAGDVIFIEDTWWGIWDIDGDFDGETKIHEIKSSSDKINENAAKTKGYFIHASSDSEMDLNALVLTIPNSIHRQWKNAQYSLAASKREDREKRQKPLNTNELEDGIQRRWRKFPSLSFLKNQHRQQLDQQQLPKPCSLESDPAYVHPSAISSTTLSQHFAQYLTTLVQRSTNPFASFVPHRQELLLPILVQTAAAVVGSVTSLGVVLQLWRVIPGPHAVLFGSACLIGLGTWGFVWLGEEIFDEMELWKERRRFEKMMLQREGG